LKSGITKEDGLKIKNVEDVVLILLDWINKLGDC
jgi:hypothetical protein